MLHLGRLVRVEAKDYLIAPSVAIGAVAAACVARSFANCHMLDFDDDGLGGVLGGGFGSAGFGSRGKARLAPKVPVTILCGFLGAGKTTLVQHILKNREGLKVGIVVNDVAEANIDSEVLRFDDADGIVGLQNGCACCSGRDDLFARLDELVKSTGTSKLDRPWDRLVVECSGVAEPESIASELEAMGKRGEEVMRRIFLAGIICMVDASTFWDMYNSDDTGDGSRRPLSVLLLSQLESADTVVINKADLVSSEELKRISDLVKALCSSARQLVATRGALPLRTLLPAEPVDIDMPAYVPTLANRHGAAIWGATTCSQPSQSVLGVQHSHDGHGDHGHTHGHSHSDGVAAGCSICTFSRHDRFGISSFVYRCSDRLFDADKLAVLARGLPGVAVELGFPLCADGSVDTSPGPFAGVSSIAVFEGVVRSKGFVRVRGCQAPYYWSHAGRRLEVRAVSETTSKGQELVFIGFGMNREGITKALDACLTSGDGARL